jgi:hypothetical protein
MGCAGGAPLFYPAHPLAPGEVRFGAGTSSTFLAGEPERAIDRASSVNLPGSSAGPNDHEVVARGAAAAALMPPGLAPWLGARAGIAPQAEAGIAYTGRATRVDARYVPLLEKRTALSVGLGMNGIFPNPGSHPPGTEQPVEASGQIPGLSTRRLTGWGAESPLIGGWRSSGDFLAIWGGPRVGYERVLGEVDVELLGGPAQEAPFEAQRWYAGAVIGLAVGVRPVWALLELDGAYHSGHGTITLAESAGASTISVGHTARISGWGFTPGAALVAEF